MRKVAHFLMRRTASSGFGEYTRNTVHNYAAEQAWLHAATVTYTRGTTLTCHKICRCW